MNDQVSRPNTPGELERLVTAAGDALTDNMVERLVEALANSLEVLDRLNDEETRDAVHCVFDEMTALHRTGGLKGVFETLQLLAAMRNAMTDSMVERLAHFVEQMVNNLANEEVAELASAATDAVHSSIDEMAGYQPPGGMMATLKMLGEPETQVSLRFLITVAGKMKEKGAG
ncbi:MAG: DUF1641 domain-containing protein [Alphaproteobacteria bacterium]|jgi:hypothetical protein|nr:DUF1641 domain-containing protein [Alphaproteobacteria bacterium]